MADCLYPNESEAYRESRDELLELEKDLRARVDAVAAKRRELPLGGALKYDYHFESATGGSTRFSDLFGPHDTLLVYSMMFGPDWDAPCPSCTSIVDALNSNYGPLSHHASIAVVAAARREPATDVGRSPQLEAAALLRRGLRLPSGLLPLPRPDGPRTRLDDERLPKGARRHLPLLGLRARGPPQGERPSETTSTPCGRSGTCWT